MHSIQQLAVAAASIFSISVALPAGAPQRIPIFVDKDVLSNIDSFSVTQIYNDNFGGDDGPAAWENAVVKYVTSLDPGQTYSVMQRPQNKQAKSPSAAPGDADNKAIDSSDLQYLTPVTVAGKNYLLNFDTGSSNLWIGGSNTLAKNKYTPTGKSASSQPWSITYADGTVASGDVFKETVVVGETKATDVAVGRAISAPPSFFAKGNNQQPGADGLLGLGFSDSNTFRPAQKTWFDTAVSQGLPNVFAANLMPGLTPGSFDFGQINPKSYSGDITYLDVVEDQPSTVKYWMVQPTNGDIGVMDTGTTLILLANTTTTKYYSSPAAKAAGARYVQSGGYWAFKCASTLPDFTVQLGAHKVVVPGEYLNYQVLQNGLCYAAIQERGLSMPFSIYGDRFLMTQYVVFDQRSGSPRIGFADKAK